MATKEHVIYNSDACAYEFDEMKKQYVDYLEVEGRAEDTVITDEGVWNYIYQELEFWYDAERTNLDKELDGRIVALANIGTWNGRRAGYKVLGSNLNCILDSFGCDNIKVYVDKHGVHSTGYHHDGTNYVDFRLLKEDTNTDLFLDKVYYNTVTDNDIKNYTRSLKPYIKEIYGW